MSRRLILIRHCHRDTGDRSLDNGLSAKGEKQRQKLVEFMRGRMTEEQGMREAAFYSSPKRRCFESIEPLAQLAGCKLERHTSLDERHKDESLSELNLRIQRLAKEWIASPAEYTFMSSHGDVLPLLAYHVLGASVDFKKGSWLEIEWENERGHLLWCIRSFKFFSV